MGVDECCKNSYTGTSPYVTVFRYTSKKKYANVFLLNLTEGLVCDVLTRLRVPHTGSKVIGYRIVWAEAKTDATSFILDFKNYFCIFLQRNL
jgi:hypothetical protein